MDLPIPLPIPRRYHYQGHDHNNNAGDGLRTGRAVSDPAYKEHISMRIKVVSIVLALFLTSTFVIRNIGIAGHKEIKKLASMSYFFSNIFF